MARGGATVVVTTTSRDYIAEVSTRRIDREWPGLARARSALMGGALAMRATAFESLPLPWRVAAIILHNVDDAVQGFQALHRASCVVSSALMKKVSTDTMGDGENSKEDRRGIRCVSEARHRGPSLCTLCRHESKSGEFISVTISCRVVLRWTAVSTAARTNKYS